MLEYEKDVVRKILDIDNANQDFKSCFVLALKSARDNTGRDVNTGEFIGNLYAEEISDKGLFESKNFTGLCCYLILLEQIGSLFIKKTYNIGQKTNGIKIALENFSLLKPDEIACIISLRHCLAHNFSLAPRPNNNPKIKKHKFCLNYFEESFAIKFNSEWDGTYTDKSDLTNTEIGVKPLCYLIEEVIVNLKNAVLNNEVKLIVKDINELTARFTVKN